MPTSIGVEIFCCHNSKSLKECMEAIELNTRGLIFLVDDVENVVGLLTDGDIRRALIDGAQLNERALDFSNRDFRYVESDNRENVLKAFDSQIKFIPVIQNGKLEKIISQSDLVYVEREGLTARAKAPARISFGGGGTDLTAFFARHGGAVLNTTINMYAHASLSQKSSAEIRIISHDYNLTFEYPSIQDVKYNGSLDLVKAAIRLLNPDFGFDLELRCDFPPNSGLGGSSVVLVAIIGCFNEFRRDKLSLYDIAELAFQCERIELQNPGGWQDQYASVFGGFNFMEFKHEKNDINPLRLTKDIQLELEERMVLCFTGKPHTAKAIHVKQKVKMENDHSIVELGKETRLLAYEMKSALLRGRIDSFAELLHRGWEMKKSFAQGISDEFLDEIYQVARSNGALGGKILGTGGGGYFLFLSHRAMRHTLTEALKKKGFPTTPVNLVEDGMLSWIVPSNYSSKDGGCDI